MYGAAATPNFDLVFEVKPNCIRSLLDYGLQVNVTDAIVTFTWGEIICLCLFSVPNSATELCTPAIVFPSPFQIPQAPAVHELQCSFDRPPLYVCSIRFGECQFPHSAHYILFANNN
jgi:hypothetical protein